MDVLPDELLLRIFSFIEDGVTLLDAVPLVCKRWLRVSRDPGAWTGVRVGLSHCQKHYRNGVFPINDGFEQNVESSVRVVLHAPSLRSICTGRECHPDLFISALRRSRCVVRELHWCNYEGFSPTSAAVRAVVLGLLWRSRDSVRALTLGDLFDSESMEPQQDGRLTVLRVLAGLRHLEELELNFFYNFRYSTKLAAGDLLLPPLRRLVLNSSTLWRDVPDRDTSVDLMCNLIRNCSESLRHLHFKNLMSHLPSAVLESVMQCTALRSVELCLLDVAAVRNMHQLHTLRLALDTWIPRDEFMPRAKDPYSPITCSLQNCEPLRGMRCLEVTTKYDPISEWFKIYREQFGELLAALAGFAAKAVTLSIHSGPGWRRGHQDPGMEPPHPAEMMDYMPDLKAVHGDFTVDELPRLYAMDLEEASGTIECRNPDEVCKKLVKDFKKRGQNVSAIRFGHDRVKFHLTCQVVPTENNQGNKLKKQSFLRRFLFMVKN